MIDKNRKPAEIENKKEGLFSKLKKKFVNTGKKVATKFGGKVLNDTFDDIIDVLGEDINKLYSNQELKFTDLSKRELKQIKKEQKLALKNINRNVGDVND